MVHKQRLRLCALKQIDVFDRNKRHQMVKELHAFEAANSPYIGVQEPSSSFLSRFQL